MLRQTVGQRCLPLALSIFFSPLTVTFPKLSVTLRPLYYVVLRGAPKGSFATLLSPPQCHPAFATMPHAFCSADQSPVCRPRTAHPPATTAPRFGFWREFFACCNAKIQLAFRVKSFGEFIFLQTVYSGSDAFAVSEQLIYTALLFEPGTPSDRPATL
jgi:hypothetical protein